ncbi:hypothetical protein ALC56_13805 [Trachymyrmex septentrionalis]|uniref:Uncharacterized protein n=1 Tax=Trachymyrmex septentrionalis TaxID=34720 RepID=A0A195EU30_9HYME|nr:hypothetical protein ALC56_13805 [Trachymyrmex septentrionalis]
MSNRSIENHIEFVLSTYLEREQGQSGAHIRRPYTGAEKDILNKNVMETCAQNLKQFIYVTQFWVYDLKKRDSHICDMQALQPLPAPTNTANTAPAMTTSGGQPPLPVSETV